MYILWTRTHNTATLRRPSFRSSIPRHDRGSCKVMVVVTSLRIQNDEAIRSLSTLFAIIFRGTIEK